MNQNIVSLDESQQKTSGLVDVESSKAVMDVQASLVIAKRFPRDEQEAHGKIIKACQRVNLADSGIYTYARGGSDISGPSIRLAETIAQYWGNLDFGWREIERRGSVSVIQAYAWEKESNTRREMTFEVKHVRNTKKGSYVLRDERDIYENNANQAARRMRACILALVPGDIVDDAVEQCERTIANRISEENVNNLMAAFSKYGVNVKMIEARIQRNLSALQPANYIDLRKVYNSLKDGMSGVSDWFDMSLIEKNQVEEKPETKLDQFKKEQVSPQKSEDAADSQEGANAGQSLLSADENGGGLPPQPQNTNNAFPGCDICHGTGIEQSVDPETGNHIKGPCPKCGMEKTLI